MPKPRKVPGKMSMIEAAEEILRKANRPLSSREIVERAVSAGLIVLSGQSPSHSLQSSIWRDIHQYRKEQSPFIMVGGDATTYRRYWLRERPVVQKHK